MVIAPADVIDIRGCASTHTLELQLADPVCVPQYWQTDVVPVFW
jgi:hypothetical protein